MKFSSKKEQIYAFLREEIMSGSIEPGARLVIDTLADELNTSQTPLREVLRMLESDGLVVIEPYVGARVADLEANSIHEIFSLLTSLEVISSKLACNRITDEQIAELAKMVTEMESFVNQPDEWSKQNKAMHAYICECAKTPLIKRMLEMSLDHWDRLRRIYLTSVSAKRVVIAQKEHVELVNALRTRNPERVEEVLERHNAASLAAYLAFLHKSGALEEVL